MKTTALFFTLVLFIHQSIAQNATRIYERIMIFNNGVLQSATPEQNSMVNDTTAFNNHIGKNLLRLNGKYYHVYFSGISGDNNIYFRKSTDGLNWSQPVQVNDDSAFAQQHSPSLALLDAGGGNSEVYVSWQDNRNASFEMRFSRSTDDGTTFSPSVVIGSNSSSVSSSGNISLDASGTLYSVWNYFDGCWNHIEFRSSSDQGLTWSAPSFPYSGGCFTDQASCIGGNAGQVAIFFSSDQFNLKNMFCLSSSDGGNTWQQVQATPYSGFQVISYYNSATTTINNELCLLFTHEINGSETKVLSIKSDDWGLTWSDSVRVSDPVPLLSSWQYQGYLMTELESGGQGRLFAAWADARYDLPSDQNFDCFIATSADTGNTWNTNLLIPQDTSGHLQAFISLCASKNSTGNDTVLVIWSDNRAFPTGVYEASGPRIKVSPNPFENYVLVQNAYAGTYFTLTDITGKVIMNETAQENNFQFDLSHLSKGMYVLQYTYKGQRAGMKLVKLH
ncbi:MAG: T9SS C-terminal target domain-containing protein [Bacteroidetes bacterium]|nr:MAG: T9SS C-terminal target domain-containing protein [Bacteroidota bacterium]REK07072.1 MAG: T9SS C-terminal target domain-containing protein [Bacteroidota bacterium]REK33582.1 MAG: T9SS C-terminal target domain-containing protein [Bacteroidota bacterium]REK48566.1 MAG: T9SS C-terminal target domain-containing protein [Bacteroidota bacterium]